MKPEEPLVPLTRDPLLARSLRVTRALLVGAAATASDVSLLSLQIRVFGVPDAIARGPALALGACVQFLGNRRFTFRAQQGSFARHARLFLVYELPGFAANWFIYTYLVRWIRFLPPELTSFVGTFLVFALYNYPMRRIRIFRLRHDEVERRVVEPSAR